MSGCVFLSASLPDEMWYKLFADNFLDISKFPLHCIGLVAMDQFCVYVSYLADGKHVGSCSQMALY